MKGHCLCGHTRFEFDLKQHQVSCCHCSMCRRLSGGANMTIQVEAKSLVFTQQQHLKFYASSPWGERGFCGNCGTNLFWRSSELNICNINVFTLNELPADLIFTQEIYVDHQPSFYSFEQKTERLTEADIIAKYAPE